MFAVFALALTFAGCRTRLLDEVEVAPPLEDAHQADGLPDDLSVPGCSIDEAVLVPVDGSSVSSRTVVPAGLTIRLRAEGTFGIGGPGLADAEYAFGSNPSDAIDQCEGSHLDVGISVDGIGSGTPRKQPRWGPLSPSHRYEVSYTGAGRPLTLKYEDCYYADNAGSLSVHLLCP